MDGIQRCCSFLCHVVSCDVTTGVLASAALLAALVLTFRLSVKYVTNRSIPRTNHLPPRSLGLGYPIVGNLPSVDRRIHVTLTDLARTGHGGLCRMRLGSWPAVVVSGQAAIREAFVRHGRALASRPDYRSYSSYADGKSISFQPYAAPLKLHRRLMLKAIRNIVETGFFERIVTRQVSELIEGWVGLRQAFDPARSVTLAVAGGLYSMCYGADALLSQNKAFEDLILETNPGTEILAFGNPVDLIPWYLCTPRTRNKYNEYVKRMTTLLRLNDQLVTHRRCHHRRHDDDDIVGAMLDASQTLDATSGLTPQHLLRTAIEVMSAGSDTSSATLLWLIHYAVKHPDAQERVRAEMRREVGPDGTVAYSDRRRLPYAESFILEAMRLRSVVPFALPHYSTEDVPLVGSGSTIPQHSLVFMNLWSVGRDRDLWGDDVDSFRPERFLLPGDGPGGASALSVDGAKASMFYPFGVGRRRCVGEMLGRIQVFLFFVNIVQRFLLKSKDVLTDEEEFGDILKPKSYSIIVEDRKLL